MSPSHLRVVEPAAEDVSFDGLYGRYARRVATIGMRIMGRTHELEDYVQDVFIQVHRNLHTLEEPAAAKFWLDRIAVRAAVRRVRSAGWKRLVGMDDAPAGLELEDSGASAEDRVLLHQLMGRLDRLPARARACWVLRQVEGYELKEVAAAVGCSLATAKRDVRIVAQALQEEQQ